MKLAELKADLNRSPIIPTITIDDLNNTLPLIDALQKGGIRVVEITLRTDIALDAIALAKKRFPNLSIGAGTVLNTDDAKAVIDHGAEFIVSPGATIELLEFMQQTSHAFVPGVITPSEVMRALDYGITFLKYFPAVASNGLNTLRAYNSVFPHVTFCPTGGLNAENFLHFLELNNVMCAGGAWISPTHLIKEQNWQVITDLCKSSLDRCDSDIV